MEGGLDGFKALVASNAHSAVSFIDYFIREDLRDYITVLLESQADILRHRDNDSAAWWDSFTFKSAESARWLLDRGFLLTDQIGLALPRFIGRLAAAISQLQNYCCLTAQISMSWKLNGALHHLVGQPNKGRKLWWDGC
ncbi:hypothetical protein LWM68_07070 [Niabella sp. W65]|nr:hypothetical protein [Niabella sp. W65]MCH7362555.1 hypothetical protein [Niabella sp. W65]ULT38510.1 hypothetical protein KRR40_25725 [Niabella sp. I65]